jgi:thiamine-phosphate pyrophosphorylase
VLKEEDHGLLLLCYVTDRKQLPGDEATHRRLLLEKIGEAARCGVDFIQLREKDLSARELEALAHDAMNLVRENPKAANRAPRTCLLLNSRTDIAVAVGADGVHLRSDDITPSEVRIIWSQCGAQTRPTIGVSCHSTEDVRRAAADRADFALFGPVFEKREAPEIPAAGIENLRRACRENIPVLALGGITLENARSCLDAGTAGFAGIRLFQENDISKVVELLR